MNSFFPLWDKFSHIQIVMTNLMELNDYCSDNVSDPARFNITIMAWNVRGLSNDAALNNLADLVNAHNPDILILTETRLTRERAKDFT